MKIATIVGARPQFIKAATVSREVAKCPELSEIIIHTGQHYDANMSDVFFDELAIPHPNHHLGIGGGSHGAMTGRQLEAIERVLQAEQPDWVLVYGDTNSTLAGALAAAKLNIPVAHVEAGLRSFNRRMPEEINRILTDHASTMLFAPTGVAVQNLRREGVSDESIRLSGDVMYDAALYYRNAARPPVASTDLRALDDFVLCTIHRAENTDDPVRLRGIVNGLGECGRSVVLPVHPRTRAEFARQVISLPGNVIAIEPVSYLEMVWLEANCAVIATDSGGVQKEAYFHGKPCVTMRDETEWTELVDAGWNCLVGAGSISIAEAIRIAKAPAAVGNLYGKGDAACKILEALL